MKFIGIKKVHEGRFITSYEAEYETELGNRKIYEMSSRDKNITSLEDLQRQKCDAVILIVTSADGNKILLNKEYRMAVGDFAYNFPAGLIDEGETIEVAAARELWEETGLKLVKIDEILPMSYSGVGLTNEKSSVVIGTAEGDFAPSTSDEEELEARWYTKEEVRELIKTSTNFAARTQSYCYMWAKS
ncbi:NUDIX hydrolase [Butyrivibrio sp. AE2032]|uniref:NUDIX hydrolase n=1 Tax=Butyrivibrio sp. AE2032 TaxID=1458463 RepID=UPI000553934F|nr:NUDIX hydrolase [Butyrivibrio sp. AE2032]